MPGERNGSPKAAAPPNEAGAMRQRRRYRPALIAVGFAAGMLTWPLAAQVAGEAQVVDGRTLLIAGQRVRLWGIVAPEPSQVCSRVGRTYPCGQVARAALWDLVAGTDVECQPVDGAATGGETTLAMCEAGGSSLNENMVHSGWALADRTVSDRYVATEEAAKEARRGLWSGDFALPAARHDAVD
jgi:endonuclease YncB( thermonuclease family)